MEYFFRVVWPGCFMLGGWFWLVGVLISRLSRFKAVLEVKEIAAKLPKIQSVEVP